MNFEDLESRVIAWACDRRIIPNSNAMSQALKTAEECVELLQALTMSQALKTAEECVELLQALNKKDSKEVIDAYGDILITLIIGAELYGVNLVACLEAGYDEIKDRKGHLGPDGIFYKDVDGSIK
jgi:NTP pyrophosphatase (non-canonical NTP hydrolase)